MPHINSLYSILYAWILKLRVSERGTPTRELWILFTPWTTYSLVKLQVKNTSICHITYGMHRGHLLSQNEVQCTVSVSKVYVPNLAEVNYKGSNSCSRTTPAEWCTYTYCTYTASALHFPLRYDTNNLEHMGRRMNTTQCVKHVALSTHPASSRVCSLHLKLETPVKKKSLFLLAALKMQGRPTVWVFTLKENLNGFMLSHLYQIYFLLPF